MVVGVIVCSKTVELTDVTILGRYGDPLEVAEREPALLESLKQK